MLNSDYRSNSEITEEREQAISKNDNDTNSETEERQEKQKNQATTLDQHDINNTPKQEQSDKKEDTEGWTTVESGKELENNKLALEAK